MPKLKLTSAVVFELPNPASGQILYYDTTTRGFGVRVGATKKSYIVEAQVNGKTRRVVIGDTTNWTTEAARKEAKRYAGQMAGGADPNAQKAEARARVMTWAEAQEAFFKGRKIKATTVANYKSVLRCHFSDWDGKQLKDLSPAMMLKRFGTIGDTTGPATANLAGRIFRSVWNFCRASTADGAGVYVLPECPVRRVSETRSWNKVARRQTYVRNDQLPAWFAAVRGLTSERHPDHAAAFSDLLELYIRTGLRRNEGMALAWKDVNLAGQTFTIAETKNGKPLTLPMSSQLVTLFERRKAATGGKGYVFAGDGKTGRLTDPRKMHEALQKACGVAFGFHDLRRTFATLAESLDLSAYAIKRLLNHADNGADVTAGYLMHDPERLRVPMQRISDELDRLARLEVALKTAA